MPSVIGTIFGLCPHGQREYEIGPAQTGSRTGPTVMRPLRLSGRMMRVEGAPMGGAIDEGCFDQRARQRDHEGAEDEDGEGDAHRGIGEDEAEVAC